MKEEEGGAPPPPRRRRRGRRQPPPQHSPSDPRSMSIEKVRGKSRQRGTNAETEGRCPHMDHMAEVRGSSSTTVQNGPFSTPPPSFIIIFRHLDRPDDADASNGDIIMMWAKLDALPPPSISGVMWG